MPMKKTLSLIAAILAVASVAAGYDPTYVHFRMTEEAFDAARANNDFLKTLQVDPGTLLDGKTARAWCAKGGSDEDGYYPYPRMLSHFYDPYNDIALSIGFCPKFPVGLRAPEWGIDSSLNTFDIVAAKQAYRDALQLPTPSQREKALARLFYALGHVVHLVQDMAQPEHTRNDQHLPFLGGSLYEKYTKKLFTDSAPPVDPNTLLTGYNPPTLPDYRSYFHTAGHQGMADYANRNFVTQDTNFHDPARLCPRFDYASPSFFGAAATTVQKTEQVKVGPFFLNTTTKVVDVTTYRRNVPDAFTGGNDPGRILTHLSFLDYETRHYVNGFNFYSLNDEAYLDQASLLMRRAVGYSAGLLQHFFRGRVAVKWTRTADPMVWDVEIANHSAEPITAAQAKVYVRFARPGSDLSLLAATIPIHHIAANGTMSATVVLGGVAFGPGESFLDFERRIVITGTLGSESDAVIGLVQAPNRGAVVAMHGVPPPQATELVRVNLGGTGSIDVLRPLGVANPFSVYGTDGDAIVSPDLSRLVYKTHTDGSLRVADVMSGAVWAPPMTTPEGNPFYVQGRPAWTRDSRRIVVWGIVSCNPVSSCPPSGVKYGIAEIDAFAGLAGFQELPELRTVRTTLNLLNWSELTLDERFLYIAEPCCGLASKMIRIDRMTSQIETGPPGYVFSEYDVADDGRLYGVGGIYEAGGFRDGVFELTWPAQWRWLAGDSTFVSSALSPNQDEIAYTKANVCNGRYQVWTVNRFTGVDRPGADACGSSSPHFMILLGWPQN